jgi:hypothetical protein
VVHGTSCGRAETKIIIRLMRTRKDLIEHFSMATQSLMFGVYSRVILSHRSLFSV